MTAAELTESFLGGVAPHKQTSGRGLKTCDYQVVKAAASDWVILGDFTVVTSAQGFFNVNQGTVEQVTIDATTTNKVVFNTATTGTLRLHVTGY